MKLSPGDYLLARIADAFPALFREAGDLETRVLGRRLSAIEIRAPIFITGLARSGTTILLTVLAHLEGVATHRYRDFPFIFTPYLWNQFQSRFAREQPPAERPHRDRIQITRESPEAFEEPIWQHFFPYLHDERANHLLTAAGANPAFEAFFTDHIRKILLVRQGDRYLSKGNYNVSRLDYLANLFPDARFIIPIRHPYTHVKSLVRQQALFAGYAASDRRVPAYLRAAGHYEFGPQRAPINFAEDDSRAIREAWSRGDDVLGYALLWRNVYQHVARLLDRQEMAERLQWVRYEDLCAQPVAVVGDLLAFAAPGQRSERVRREAAAISAPPDGGELSAESCAVIWQATRTVARQFGYENHLTASLTK